MEEQQNDRSGLLAGSSRQSTGSDGNQPLYHDSRASPTSRLMHLAFVCIVVLMVLISFILSIYRSTVVTSSKGLYVMLGLSLLAFVALEIIMVIFLKRGDIQGDKTWFLYAVGGAIILESIFTNVLLFED